MFLHAKPQAAAVPPVVQAPRPTELSGEVSHGFSYVATATGYSILRDGAQVAIGLGNACVETNAQRARQALANRGVTPN